MVVIAVLAVLAETLWLTSRMTTARYIDPVPLVCLQISTDVGGDQKEQWATERRSGSCKGRTIKHKKEIGGSPCGMYTDLNLYQQSFKPFYQVPCYSAALLSPRPVSFDISTTLNQTKENCCLIFQPHWIKLQKRGNCCLIFQPYWDRQQQWKILAGRVGASAETGKVGEREAEGEVGSCGSSDAGANNTTALSILFWKSIFGGSFPVIGLSHRHWSD